MKKKSTPPKPPSPPQEEAARPLIQADEEIILKLTKDLKTATKSLNQHEARFLVDTYYQMQGNRIRAREQIRSMEKSGEPHAVLDWLFSKSKILEGQIAAALKAYVSTKEPCVWAMRQKGIGPIISAGLYSRIDISRAPTVGHIWSYAGLNPNAVWEKGQKRPWNAALKKLCWLIGESFVKVSGRDNAYYGKLYVERKAYEEQKNLLGAYKAIADVRATKVGKDTIAYSHYSKGFLPPAHIHSRAKRYAVKMFLAHFHEVWYRDHFKKDPPLPYPIAHLGHAHKIEVPIGDDDDEA